MYVDILYRVAMEDHCNGNLLPSFSKGRFPLGLPKEADYVGPGVVGHFCSVSK